MLPSDSFLTSRGLEFGRASPLDSIVGTSGNDSLVGTSGDDTIDGGAGADTMVGGLGNDTYIVDNVGDVVREFGGAGLDWVRASVSYTLSANVENLTLTGGAGINATGNGLANVLNGNAGNNVLDGGLGADTMSGGAGDDTYVVAGTGDVVIEASGAGVDLVQSSISYVLGANVENLTLTDSANLNGTGNGLANVLTGNAGNNHLNGGTGADTLIGGMGDDTYVIDGTGDVIIEAADAGIDLVQSSVSRTLGANLENLTLTGAANINGIGNGLNNLLIGNAGNNMLNGGLGNDTMRGGLGDDVYTVDNPRDVVYEAPGAGTDLIILNDGYYTMPGGVENMTFGASAINGTGNALNNVITGNVCTNELYGGGGEDTLIGGAGNDYYTVDSAGDGVIEAADSGTDSVDALVDYTLPANVENLTLAGNAGLTGTGNALDNIMDGSFFNDTLIGGDGNDSLNGHGGHDVLAGGGGDDSYWIDDSADQINELPGEGFDSVFSTVNFSLSEGVENLTLLNGGVGIGNASDNVMRGASLNDTLDGGGGADTLIGGLGNDTYVADNVGDVVMEDVNAGIDQVFASADFTLSDEVENLTLTGSAAISGTGNALNNLIVGNAAANALFGGIYGNDTLDGGAGADTLSGGFGNDTYIVDNIGDVVVEPASRADRHTYDIVLSSVSYTLSDNVERLTLTGNADLVATGNNDDNVITGNSGNDTLDGGAGADAMYGGYGNDTYFVDNPLDSVSAFPGGRGQVDAGVPGVGTVIASCDYYLSERGDANVLVLVGADALRATGNSSANLLIGNESDNSLVGDGDSDTLVGGQGNDQLTGGWGSDLFTLSSLVGSDTVTDFATAIDAIVVDQSGITVGNGDQAVDGATTVQGPGGFDSSAELVVFTNSLSGAITNDAAAEAIGSANGAYAANQTALFVLNNGSDSAVYFFQSADADAAVSAGELTLLATLQGAASTATADYLFGG